MMMSEERNNSSLSAGLDKRRQWVQAILSSLTTDDFQNGDAPRLLQEGLLRAYNYSLSPSELARLETIWHRQPDLGPKREALSTVIPITIIYSLIFVTGIVGNVCTCLVIIRNKYMRTVTNYYLFNLSMSDLLLLLLGLPQETYETWSAYPFLFGKSFCRLRLLASEASSYVSILTITAFTVERYVAICHPIKFPTHPGLSRPLRVMLAVWIISTLCAIPVGLQYGIVYMKDASGLPILESAQCNTLNPDVAKIVFQVSTFIFFVLPMSVISLLYFFIALAIKRSALTRAGSDTSNRSNTHNSCDVRPANTNHHHTRIRQSVLKMLVAVVVAFFLCWAPFHTQRLLVTYVHSWTPVVINVHDILFYVSGVTYYLSATINPVLYSIMSLKFRQAFRQTLLSCCFCWTRRRPKRRVNKNSYTFKFHPRGHINTNCSVVESSSSTNNNGTNNNKQGNGGSNQSTPVLCCVAGNGAVSTHIEGRPLVEMFACEAQRGHTYESNCTGQPNTMERMV